MSEKLLLIHSFEALKQQMKTQEFYVEWTVYSAIGPNWIGSYRKMEFRLGDHVVGESIFFNALKKKFVETLQIPETSEDLVIYGDAYVHLKQNTLIADYSWDAAAPYDEVAESDKGEKVFYP